jgi:hypothetical protein
MLVWAVCVVSLLLGGYFAGYFCFVKPATYCRKEIWPVYIWREYPLPGQHFWQRFYAPLHWVDVRIRTRLWRPARPEEFRGRVYYHPGFVRDE